MRGGKHLRRRKASQLIAIAVILTLFFGCFSGLRDLEEEAGPADASTIPGTSSVSVISGDRSISPLSSTNLPIKPKWVRFSEAGLVQFETFPNLHQMVGAESYSWERDGVQLTSTIEPRLQEKARLIFERYRVPWGALVAIEPKTGRVRALVSHSSVNPEYGNIALLANYPAASLFKLVTAAAAIEQQGLDSDSVIRYRGGDYTLNLHNYYSDFRRDRKIISFAEALGRSCNPAFARVALDHLSPGALQDYALNFAFDADLSFEVPVSPSHFTMPGDRYDVARTAAGFGEVRISPLHAAVITAAIANDGVMMRPHFIERITAPGGLDYYHSSPLVLRQVILPSTARTLREMMTFTVTSGTARKHFGRSKTLAGMSIAAKTGTLRGDNPEGVHHWFVASAPIDNPEIAIAVLVVDPGSSRINGSGVGKQFLEHFFSEAPAEQSTAPGTRL